MIFCDRLVLARFDLARLEGYDVGKAAVGVLTLLSYLLGY